MEAAGTCAAYCDCTPRNVTLLTSMESKRHGGKEDTLSQIATQETPTFCIVRMESNRHGGKEDTRSQIATQETPTCHYQSFQTLRLIWYSRVCNVRMESNRHGRKEDTRSQIATQETPTCHYQSY
ncbi:hypothetical protein J6590_013886 [Homalodisca vitripennis]|nr:hypothetical protein J6590_013886 [Homalodisca vitripennis]